MEPARFTFVRCDHHHNHWIWSYCTKDFHGPDCNHGIRCFWVANFHALAQQCWHSSCSDIYIPLRQCLLLCLSKGETEERFVKDHHIVSSCTNEISRLLKPTSDEEYISIVEKLLVSWLTSS